MIKYSHRQIFSWKVIRTRFLTLAFIFMNLYHASGQISISASTDRDRYIRFEPVKLTVSLKNYSGHTLSFGGREAGQGDFLKFVITNTEGRTVSQLNQELRPEKGLELPPGAGRSITIFISEFFGIQNDDDYELVIRVGHHRFENDFLSAPIHFQVRGGVRVWSRVVGTPGENKVNTIATRTCSLNTIHYEEGDIYFLQIEDNHYVYATIRLGPRVLGINPQCEIDALSRVHTLIQTAPRLLNYKIFDLDGDMKQSSHYMIEKTVPGLFRDPELGTVSVVGGRSAIEGVDFKGGDLIYSDAENLPNTLF